MAIRIFKPCTPGTRHKGSFDFTEITKDFPEKTLTFYKHRVKGRNVLGKITLHHRGGGHKKLYRKIDFKRNKINVLGRIIHIEYDPNRNVNLALIQYIDGKKHYILHPSTLKANDYILSGPNSEIKIGNSLPLNNIPLGINVHNIELTPKQGGKLVRSAGTSAKILAKEGNYVTLRLPSKEIRLIRKECYATIGNLGNSVASKVCIGKAGRTRWFGIRPTVRGVAMNPCDHPHGGGEGRSPIGRKRPMTPWGHPALGVQTRKKNKSTNIYILRKRK